VPADRGKMTIDLTTTYLGLALKNPIVASASPLTGDLDSLCQLEEAGAAVVLPSLFETRQVPTPGSSTRTSCRPTPFLRRHRSKSGISIL
jgi:dihydroorotate dehydrogenase